MDGEMRQTEMYLLLIRISIIKVDKVGGVSITILHVI